MGHAAGVLVERVRPPKVPKGFKRVDLTDVDHRGHFWRRRGEWMEYWNPDSPTRLRQERPLGVTGKVVRWVELGARSQGN